MLHFAEGFITGVVVIIAVILYCFNRPDIG